jgi:hypothetical protein
LYLAVRSILAGLELCVLDLDRYLDRVLLLAAVAARLAFGRPRWRIAEAVSPRNRRAGSFVYISLLGSAQE